MMTNDGEISASAAGPSPCITPCSFSETDLDTSFHRGKLIGKSVVAVVLPFLLWITTKSIMLFGEPARSISSTFV